MTLINCWFSIISVDITTLLLLPSTFYLRGKKAHAVNQITKSLEALGVVSSSFLTVWQYVHEYRWLIIIHFRSRPSIDAIKEANVELDAKKLYLVDGLQRYYAAQETGNRFVNWNAVKLPDRYCTITDLQVYCYQHMILNTTVTPLTFVDKCNMIVNFCQQQS